MREYLRAGKLALVLGETLFVHGGLDEHCLDWAPEGHSLPVSCLLGACAAWLV